MAYPQQNYNGAGKKSPSTEEEIKKRLSAYEKKMRSEAGLPQLDKTSADWKNHDERAERIVIASMVRHNALIPKHMGDLTTDDFHITLHKQIWGAMLRLAPRGQPCKVSTLARAIEIETQNSDPSREANIQKIVDAPEACIEISGFIQDLLTFTKRRAVVELATDFLSAGKSGGPDIVNKLSQAVFSLGNGRGRADNFVKMDKTADEVLQQIWEDDQHGWGPTGIPSGFPELDNAIGGFKSGKFYVVAAMEKAGKSSLGLAFIHALLQQDVPTALFSLEMRKDEVMKRCIQLDSNVPLFSRKRGSVLSNEERDAVKMASANFQQYPFYCTDLSDLSPGAIAMACRRAKQEWNIQAIVIDYMQIIESDEGLSKDDTRRRVEAASKAMRRLAKDLDVIMIGLAQLNRKPLDRVAGKHFNDFKPELGRPRRGDIRETAQLEMDADAIIALYRPEILLDEMRPIAPSVEEEADFNAKMRLMRNSVELNLVVNRSGPSGVKAPVNFDGPLMKFTPKGNEKSQYSGPFNTGFGDHKSKRRQ